MHTNLNWDAKRPLLELPPKELECGSKAPQRKSLWMQVGVSASPIMRDSGDDNVRFAILSVKTTDEPKAAKTRKQNKKINFGISASLEYAGETGWQQMSCHFSVRATDELKKTN